MLALALLATVLLAVAQLAAQDEAQPALAAAEEQEEEKDKVQLQVDHLRYDAGIKKYILTDVPSGEAGDQYPQVIYTHEDTKLYCDRSEYDEEEDTAIAIGNLRVVSPDSTTTGEVVNADFDKEIMTITGSVVIVTQKKREQEKEEEEPQAPSASENEPVAEAEQTGEEGNQPATESTEDDEGFDEYRYKKTTIWCDKIEYHYADDVKIAYITGPLKAVQEDKTAWADTATYRELDDILEVEGNVRVLTEDGDEFRCPKATIAVDDDWMEVERVEGLIIRKKEEAAEPAEPGAALTEETPTTGLTEEAETPPVEE